MTARPPPHHPGAEHRPPTKDLACSATCSGVMATCHPPCRAPRPPRFEGAEEAWKIIKAGPEPLVSQFSVSYGLVLNLLSVNGLEQVNGGFGDCRAACGGWCAAVVRSWPVVRAWA
jgi:hypothetical protein